MLYCVAWYTDSRSINILTYPVVSWLWPRINPRLYITGTRSTWGPLGRTTTFSCRPRPSHRGTRRDPPGLLDGVPKLEVPDGAPQLALFHQKEEIAWDIIWNSNSLNGITFPKLYQNNSYIFFVSLLIKSMCFLLRHFSQRSAFFSDYHDKEYYRENIWKVVDLTYQ